MIKITPQLAIDDAEIKLSFMASPGPGGQNVNKVATAVLLRFNVWQSASLSEEVRQRLLVILKSRLTTHGDLIIKATRYRTQERNKQDALDRLITLLKSAAIPPKKRKKTRPTKASIQRRLDHKKVVGNKKSLRQKYHSDIT